MTVFYFLGWGGPEIRLLTKFQYCTVVENDQIRPKMRVFYSEKVTYSGLNPLKGDIWQFWWLYQTDPIPVGPWETQRPNFILWPMAKNTLFWPQKWSKMVKNSPHCHISFGPFWTILGAKIGCFWPLVKNLSLVPGASQNGICLI